MTKRRDHKGTVVIRNYARLDRDVDGVVLRVGNGTPGRYFFRVFYDYLRGPENSFCSYRFDSVVSIPNRGNKRPNGATIGRVNRMLEPTNTTVDSLVERYLPQLFLD